MSSDERNLEVRGENVEEAIAAGLAELGLERTEVDVEIIDEGSGGFLGIGGREAVVRLLVKPDVPEQIAPPTVSPTETAFEEAAESRAEVPPGAPEEEAQDEGEVALEIVEKLLQKLQVEAATTLRQSEPDDLSGERRWIVDVRGQDMGLLIGPRGETLNSLQYIARLMTGHILRQRPTFIVDIEGYRERREAALARLAERMADKVLRLGRPLSLEPMPPNERRIIHMTLRENEKVYTESSGEGSRRKVRIYPKQ